MARDEDDSGGHGPLESVAGSFALVAIIAAAGRDYVRDLHASARTLFGGDGLEAALKEERARNKAMVLALAVIADGAVTDAERAALAEIAKRHRVDADSVLSEVASLAEELRDAAVLRAKVARHAAELSPSERLDLFVAVKNLSHRGSRAWPDESGYRGAGEPTPEALVRIFRDALGITG